MTVVLFCGGQGLRLRERANDVPKPLVPIGGEPALYHLMRYYAHHGHRHFVLCLAHGAQAMVEHFVSARGRVAAEPRDDGSVRVILRADDGARWTVHLVPTAPAACVAERLRAVRSFVEGPMFLCNYADGLSDLDLPAFLADFAASGAIAGLISVPAPWGFHLVSVEADGRVSRLSSAEQSGLRINGGFCAMRREVFDHLGPGEDLARDLFPRLIAAGRLFGYRHDGFWACMDTPQDWRTLSEIDAGGAAPWKIWLPQAGAGPAPTPVAEVEALR
jgi:glucose-1-phosphate cytidylyltransferase